MSAVSDYGAVRTKRGLSLGWRIVIAIVVVIVVAIAAFVAYAWRPAIAEVERPSPASFDSALVARGSVLASIGNCAVCHTAQGGTPLAGGLALATPFGTVHSTNITPDPNTGIGRWSEAAFMRAMREGVDREGNHLYPAFPYDHFTLVTDDDDRALYAYLMTRAPVHAERQANQLLFPVNIRLLVAGWKALFFHKGPFRPDPAKDETWNRGAYLAEGLGHCGACHTPRNALGAEDADRRYSGGEAEGWNAYAINASSPAPVPWNVASLDRYLNRGFFPTHGMARGAMSPVVSDLGSVPQADVHAIATYVASLMGAPNATTMARATEITKAAGTRGNGGVAASGGTQTVPLKVDASADVGGQIYGALCATCHEARRAVPLGGIDLHLSTAMNGPTPQNPLNVILYGIPQAEGAASGTMPGFAGALTDEQVTALLNYLRSNFSDKPAWTGVADLVRRTRAGAIQVTTRQADGLDQSPALSSRRETTW